MKTHILKQWPVYFQEVIEGKKKFEFRKNDRDYQVGDTIILKEWEPNLKTRLGEYTGRESVDFSITSVLTDMQFSIPQGYIVFSIIPSKEYITQNLIDVMDRHAEPYRKKQ